MTDFRGELLHGNVSVFGLANANGIKIGRYSKNKDFLRQLGLSASLTYPGLALRIGEEYAIFYDDGLSISEARFVVAHELGHIFLGHLLSTAKDNGEIEQEANTFAEHLLSLCRERETT